MSTANSAISSRRQPGEPIAIIGIGCRFPGGVHDAPSFWQLVRDGVDAISDMPPERMDLEAYDPDPAAPWKQVTRRGGYLAEVAGFDAQFFGISPREAVSMDPQQRLLLEVAVEALEDAGIVVDVARRNRTGVFIGMMTNDYEDLMYSDPARLSLYSLSGGGRYGASGRVSYCLGLEGPSITLDTACSSSLVSVHLACESLRTGECSLALAGGVHLLLEPQINICLAEASLLALDGHCKFGDARADGFVRSEGAGLLVLKRLEQARADGDPIYAVIRGSAVNTGGRSSRVFVTPSRSAQEDVVREALRVSGLTPAQVQCVEAHGTGTVMGDGIEIEALGAVFSDGHSPDDPCRVGSVKTNIGHSEGASGVASLIKAALSLQHRQVPPSLHFLEPNPRLAWESLPVRIPTRLEPWPACDGPARIGVNSFGLTGTNAHLVLEEAPGSTSPVYGGGPESRTTDEAAGELFVLSARTRQALDDSARALLHQLEHAPDACLSDLCYTAAVRRAHHEHRAALVCRSHQELRGMLAALLEAQPHPGLSVGLKLPDAAPRLVFVFPGQGSQWIGMGRALLAQEPVFRSALEACDRLMQPYLEASLLEELTGPAEHSRLDRVEVIQPAIFALQVALAALWQSWGIVPDVVVGHSMGEVAAARVAGILSLEDAVRIICRRSRLVKASSGHGGMLTVDLSLEQARAALRGYEDRVAVGASNSPRTTVLSGEVTALKELHEKLERQEVYCRWVKVDYASHSPQMDALRPELLSLLAGIAPLEGRLPLYSTVRNRIAEGPELDAAYWADNLREPVLLWPAVHRLAETGHTHFVEVSPHPVLLPALEQGLRHIGSAGKVLTSMRRDEDSRAVMLGSLGSLYTAGAPVAWAQLYARGRLARLPFYPWQRDRYWLEPSRRSFQSGTASTALEPSSHPLLGTHLAISVEPAIHAWTLDLGLETLPFLQDHRVLGAIVLPGAAMLEMALAAAPTALGPGRVSLTDVDFARALILPEDQPRTVQLVITVETPETAIFRISSRQQEGGLADAGWTAHATGRLARAVDSRAPQAAESLEAIRERCRRHSHEHGREGLSGGDFYQMMHERGLEYGPTFQGVLEVECGAGESLARVSLPESALVSSATTARPAYGIHPALLDACFQNLLAALPRDDAQTADRATFVPVAIAALRQYAPIPPDAGLWSHARLQPAGSGAMVGDLQLLDASGRIVLEASGFRLQRMESATPRDAADPIDQWLYTIRWDARPLPLSPLTDAPGRWLILTDRGGVGQAVAEALQAAGGTCFLASVGEKFVLETPDRARLNPISAEQMRTLMQTVLASGQPLRGIVHLWSLEMPNAAELTTAALEQSQSLGLLSAVHLAQAVLHAGLRDMPRLWLVTRGAQVVTERDRAPGVAQSPLFGLSRVIQHEHAGLQAGCIDLDAFESSVNAGDLARELLADDEEREIALRNGARYVSRMIRLSTKGTQGAQFAHVRIPAGDSPFLLTTSAPGMLEHLHLEEAPRPAPGPDEVEIEVIAAGLNFLDVMSAMGIRPDQPPGPIRFGAECAGRITRLGERVEGLEPGDEVIAIGMGCMSTYTVVPACFVVRKPTRLSFQEAAGLPIVFMTAYHSLYTLGRLGRGERVLIHAGAGGVGLAALQLAQRVGAEVLATAGSPEKRALLQTLGVRHVMDSRTLAFADEVLTLTGGRGVDVVLNSLAGEAIAKGVATLAPYGRFLEIGKRDIYQNRSLGLWPFQRNLSYFAIDLARMMLERPEECGQLLRTVVGLFEEGALQPLPIAPLPVSEADVAFRSMAQARHIGKIVLSLKDERAELAASSPRWSGFRSDASYLITGGLGGLGLTIARWMVDRGARHLILVGRSAPSADARSQIAELEAAGARVLVAQGDVSREEDVARLLAEAASILPPLRGVLHAAAILDDATLLHLDADKIRAVMAAKVSGAWNLHRLTREMPTGLPLELFVLFSSAASLMGSAGQGNYAAANAFLDALAHHRRASGLPAVAINWGAWADVGLAAALANRGQRLEAHGMASMKPAQGVRALGRVLELDLAQVGVIPLQARQWREFHPTVASLPLFSELMSGQDSSSPQASPSSAVMMKLQKAEPGSRRNLLEDHLREQISQVLKLSPSRIETHTPLYTLGFDSLMTLEFRNRLEGSLGSTLPATLLWNHPTIEALIPYLAQRIGLSLAVETSMEGAPPGELEREARAAPRSEPRADTPADARGQSRAEPRADAPADTRADARGQSRADARSEPRADAPGEPPAEDAAPPDQLSDEEGAELLELLSRLTELP